jgi:hypothetical protein
MSKSIERQVKDAIIAKLKSLTGVASVDTSGRERLVTETDLTSGEPSVFVQFPSSGKSGGCGFAITSIPVLVDARFRFDGDLDALDLEAVRDALDALEQKVHAAMIEDRTWSGLAFETLAGPRNFKATSEDVAVPEASLALTYEVIVHHKADDPTQAM